MFGTRADGLVPCVSTSRRRQTLSNLRVWHFRCCVRYDTDSPNCPRVPARMLRVFVFADGCATHGRGQENVCKYFGRMPHTKPCEAETSWAVILPSLQCNCGKGVLMCGRMCACVPVCPSTAAVSRRRTLLAKRHLVRSSFPSAHQMCLST